MEQVEKLLLGLEDHMKTEIDNIKILEDNASELNVDLTDRQESYLRGRRTLAQEYLCIIDNTKKKLNIILKGADPEVIVESKIDDDD